MGWVFFPFSFSVIAVGPWVFSVHLRVLSKVVTERLLFFAIGCSKVGNNPGFKFSDSSKFGGDGVMGCNCTVDELCN
jgi:hypothetical protein